MVLLCALLVDVVASVAATAAIVRSARMAGPPRVGWPLSLAPPLLLGWRGARTNSPPDILEAHAGLAAHVVHALLVGGKSAITTLAAAECLSLQGAPGVKRNPAHVGLRLGRRHRRGGSGQGRSN